MADPRVPYFELHIRPMTRLLDREQMRDRGFDLWRYEDVTARADDIIRVVSAGTMPPKSHGGPWPQEWIDLFTRWKDSGFQRLTLGTASGGITAARSGDTVTMTAKGRHPGPGFTAWLDLESVSDTTRAYRLVVQPPPIPEPGPERGFTAREIFQTASPAISMTVTDTRGTHDIQIAAGTFVHLLGSFSGVRDRRL